MPDTVTFLWFADRAEEAARFYVSLLPDSRIEQVWTMAAESPAGAPGSVKVVEFTLAGRRYAAMQTPDRQDPFNNAISLMVECDTQVEVDRLWAALSEGGQPVACGWLKDRYGVSWQITPGMLMPLMRGPDRARARRVAEAMMGMVKLDIAALEAAARG